MSPNTRAGGAGYQPLSTPMKFAHIRAQINCGDLTPSYGLTDYSAVEGNSAGFTVLPALQRQILLSIHRGGKKLKLLELRVHLRSPLSVLDL
jgi:hypothetical protein